MLISFMLNIPLKAISLTQFLLSSTTHIHTQSYILSSIFFLHTQLQFPISGYFFFFLIISSSIAHTQTQTHTPMHHAHIYTTHHVAVLTFPILFHFINPFSFSPFNHPFHSPFFFCVHFFNFFMPFFFRHSGSSRARILYVTAYMRPTIYPPYKLQYFPSSLIVWRPIASRS